MVIRCSVHFFASREKEIEPHIVCIERMWREENGEELLYGCWLYRPQETYHAASRKFLEKVCEQIISTIFSLGILIVICIFKFKSSDMNLLVHCFAGSV